VRHAVCLNCWRERLSEVIDLANLTPYIYPLALAWVVLILVALLLAPTWEHLKWERRQRRRRY
jgi:hypothetical protein